jgi:hypothetical protein
MPAIQGSTRDNAINVIAARTLLRLGLAKRVARAQIQITDDGCRALELYPE